MVGCTYGTEIGNGNVHCGNSCVIKSGNYLTRTLGTTGKGGFNLTEALVTEPICGECNEWKSAHVRRQ